MERAPVFYLLLSATIIADAQKAQNGNTTNNEEVNKGSSSSSAPGPVVNLTVIAGAKSIRANWRPPPGGIGWSDHYRVCFSTKEDIIWTEADECQNTTATSSTRETLVPEMQYQIGVRVVYQQNEQLSYGEETSVNTTTLCEKSSHVSSLERGQVTSEYVEIQWRTPGKVCGALGSYVVHYSPPGRSGEQSISVSPAANNDMNTAAIFGLISSTSYRMSVRLDTEDPFGSVLTGEATEITIRTAPGPVVHLTVIAGAKSIRANWQPPPGGNGWSYHYRVCFSTKEDIIWTDADDCQNTHATSSTRETLLPEMRYQIGVRVVYQQNRQLSYGKETSVYTKTLCEKSSKVSSIGTGQVTSEYVLVQWRTPEKLCGALGSYVVQYSPAGMSVKQSITVSPAANNDMNSAAISGLVSGTSYRMRVRLDTKDPFGSVLTGEVTEITIRTAPGEVMNLSVIANARSLTVVWLPPRAGIDAGIDYRVCVSMQKNISWTNDYECQKTSEPRTTILYLVPEMKYQIGVRVEYTQNGQLSYGQDKSVSATTLCEKSEAVEFVKPPSVFTNYMKIQWRPPTKVCGEQKEYVIHYKSVPSGRILTNRSTSPHAAIFGLTSNTVYNFSIALVTTEPSTAILTGHFRTAFFATAVEKAANVLVTRITSTSAEASWTPPPKRRSELSYEVSLYAGDSSKKPDFTNFTSDNFYDVRNLIPETTYHLIVVAKASHGPLANPTLSTSTEALIFSTDCSVPEPPAFHTIRANWNLTLYISWTPPSNKCLNISYVIFVVSENDTQTFATSQSALKTSALQPYTNYSITVSAIRMDGKSDTASRNSSVSYVTTEAGEPSWTTSSVKYDADHCSVSVSWNEPASWNGEAGGYIIVLEDANETVVAAVKKRHNEVSHKFMNLVSSTAYRLSVIAYNTKRNSSAAVFSVTTAHKSEPLTGLDNARLEITIPLVGLLLILAVALPVGLWLRKRRAKPGEDSLRELRPLKSSTTPEEVGSAKKTKKKPFRSPPTLLVDEQVAAPADGAVYGNLIAPGVGLSELPMLVLNEYAKDAPFADEFKELKTAATSLQTVGQKAENKPKNKFRDIIPYDHNRVALTPVPGEACSDYINASYIESFGGEPMHYIAAQGPTNNTISDFWRMVLEVQSEVIVMVTRLIEAGVIKCAMYWPESGSKSYGDVDVTLLSSETFPDYHINILKVAGAGSQLTVKHFYFTAWPDHGVPDYAVSFLKFRRNVLSFTGSSTRPIIVHCSAGVGRTGTFIAIDYLLSEARRSGRVAVLSCVQRLRDQRPRMVQTRDQYAFIYHALMEATQAGESTYPNEHFFTEYKSLMKEKKTLLRKQYEIFAAAIQPITEERCSVALLPENVTKNFDAEIVPANTKRPILLTASNSDGATDYINAVYLNGYKKKDAFIVTQHPLASTIADFWRLVLDHRVGTIVSLDNLLAKDSAARYWPDVGDGFPQSKPIDVQYLSSSSDSSTTHRTRDFRITHQESGQGWTLRQFEYLGWPDTEQSPVDEHSFLELISAIDKWTPRVDAAGTTLVHCRNGARKSGLLVAAMNTLRCVEAEQVVDVYMTALILRQHRPQLIGSLDQYGYLYKLVAAYMESFETYSNFLPQRT